MMWNQYERCSAQEKLTARRRCMSVEPLESREMLSANALTNGDFSVGLDGWLNESHSQATAVVVEVGSNPAVALKPTETGTARISQPVVVQPDTTYELSGKFTVEDQIYAYLGVKDYDGQGSELAVGDNRSDDYTLTFTTGVNTTVLTVYVQAYRQQQGMVVVDQLQLEVGDGSSGEPIRPAEPGDPSGEIVDVILPTWAAAYGDFNSDNRVDAADYTIYQDTAGSTTDLRADADGNGMIGPEDYSAWRGRFGTPPPEPSPAGPDAQGNWVVNGDFWAGTLDGWDVTGENLVKLVAGDPAGFALELDSTETASSRVRQTISGLKPATQYTFGARVRTSEEGVWASFGVDQGVQFVKTNAATGATWQEKQFIFYTDEQSTQVELFLEAYQGQSGSVYFDDIRLVEGALPLPKPPPDTSWPTAPELPGLVPAGGEIIKNNDFAQGLDGWVTDHATWHNQGSQTEVTLEATVEESARAVQDIPIALAPCRTYTLVARAKAVGDGATITITDRQDLSAGVLVGEGQYQDIVIQFTTGDAYTYPRIVLEHYKGTTGSLTIDRVSLLAQGGEWLDTPEPVPKPTTEILIDDFSTGLDPEKWLIVDKAWGGENGGLVPENVEITDGILKLNAHGDLYAGDVTGHGDRTTRVGAGIASRDYYASGRYEVRARIPQVLGAASAFWTFHYVEHFPDEAAYWQEPSRVRNSEIDWEFPTALQTGGPNDPVSYDYARVNSWGGKLGGEGAHHPGRVEVVSDGEFHTYGIEWHTGGDGELPRVIWTVDGAEVYRHEGNMFGQDNIPARASRFWLGIWFPAAGFKEQLEGEYVDRVGWAGDPNFDQATLEIDWVRITPFSEPNDLWEAETWPNGWYALPHEYP